MDRSLAVLVGNGLSIAYNPELRLDATLPGIEFNGFDLSETQCARAQGQ